VFGCAWGCLGVHGGVWVCMRGLHGVVCMGWLHGVAYMGCLHGVFAWGVAAWSGCMGWLHGGGWVCIQPIAPQAHRYCLTRRHTNPQVTLRGAAALPAYRELTHLFLCGGWLTGACVALVGVGRGCVRGRRSSCVGLVRSKQRAASSKHTPCSPPVSLRSARSSTNCLGKPSQHQPRFQTTPP